MNSKIKFVCVCVCAFFKKKTGYKTFSIVASCMVCGGLILFTTVISKSCLTFLCGSGTPSIRAKRLDLWPLENVWVKKKLFLFALVRCRRERRKKKDLPLNIRNYFILLSSLQHIIHLLGLLISNKGKGVSKRV